MTLKDAKRDIAQVESLIGFRLTTEERIEALMRIRHLSFAEALLFALQLNGGLVLSMQTKFVFESGCFHRLYSILKGVSE